ncbi:hypothetical protein ABZ942_15465 [Nocardia sp. NPDC046473]|uniref:hypothetical protein n=1 Tax=Nocardia sp. NPDC046473 TaxID=3155733 RepID=UPI0033D52490
MTSFEIHTYNLNGEPIQHTQGMSLADDTMVTQTGVAPELEEVIKQEMPRIQMQQ